jgi:hypothetical protein
MKKAAAVLVLIMMAGNPAPVICGLAGAESWQLFTEAQGGVAYTFAPEGIIRTGDHVQVRVRAVELLTTGKEQVTTILYDLDCRQRTFRMIEIVEEHEGVLSVCKNPSDEFPIRPGKHPHLEKLRTRICP